MKNKQSAQFYDAFFLFHAFMTMLEKNGPFFIFIVLLWNSVRVNLNSPILRPSRVQRISESRFTLFTCFCASFDNTYPGQCVCCMWWVLVTSIFDVRHTWGKNVFHNVNDEQIHMNHNENFGWTVIKQFWFWSLH